MINKNAYEYILDEKNAKFSTFPITYQDIWDEYKDQMAAFWKAEEIDFSGDYEDFLTLNPNEQHFIKLILAFFVNFDGIVNMNLTEQFTKEIQITEIVMGYQFQVMMENIHSEVYSLMLDNIIRDRKEKDKLFDSINTIDSIKRMADWAIKWSKSDSHIAYRLIAFIIVEGIFFSGAFAAIFWLKYYKASNKLASNAKNKAFMSGLVLSNMFISRDEGKHYLYGCKVFEKLENKPAHSEVLEILTEAVTIAQQFYGESLPVSLIGMNIENMNHYIEYIADILLVLMGYKKHYMQKNPFTFMNNIGLNVKTSFHEINPTEYQDSHVKNKSKGQDSDCLDTDDF